MDELRGTASADQDSRSGCVGCNLTLYVMVGHPARFDDVPVLFMLNL